jgi:periplasmic protein TonB
MFDNSLIDSGAQREPVLKRPAWLISLVLGATGWLVGYFALHVFSAAAGGGLLLVRSAILGIGVFCYALMLCYVYAEGKRVGLRWELWVGVTLLFNLIGFLAYLVRSASKTGDWKRATVPAAYVIEATLVAALALAPLIYTQALPRVLTGIKVPSPAAPLGTRATPPAVKVVRRASSIDITKAPVEIPKTIAQIHDEPARLPDEPSGVLGSLPPGVQGGSEDGVWNSIMTGLSASVPPPRPKVTKVTRIVVGGRVEAAKAIFQPKPEYPPLAKMARIQGAVRLEAVISRDGTIQDLKLISGHPLLVKAAEEAVARWRYQPTLLNGEPVEVATEIDVDFILSD